MQKQKTVLPDGRYLIYYTFGRSTVNAPVDKPDHKSQVTNPKSSGGKR